MLIQMSEGRAVEIEEWLGQEALYRNRIRKH